MQKPGLLLIAAAASALQPPRLQQRRTRLHAAPAPAYVAGACLTGIAWKPVVTRAMDEWYDNDDTKFRRPAWAPPRKWFPPIWRVNYFLIGWAASRRAAFGGIPRIAWVHYLLNMCWAPLFFHYRRLKAAVVLNAALVATLVVALPSFAEAGAALLLTPYLGWLAFATILSLQIARLNPAGVVMSSTGAWRSACDASGVVSWYDFGVRL
jgi:benzodiazapine receptor